jgi:hypothetical protein
MDTPVTHQELKTELAKLETRIFKGMGEEFVQIARHMLTKEEDRFA